MAREVRIAAVAALWVLCASSALALPRTYLQIAGGANVLNTNLSDQVVKERVVGHFEIAVGGQLTDRTLLELSFATMGEQEDVDARPIFDLDDLLVPDRERVYKVQVNPLMLRVRHARSGMRSGYVKPEFSFGLGAYSVTRWLRNFASIPPEPTSQLLPAVELGASMMMILGQNFSGSLGARYTMMQRRGISQSTEHLDGLSLLLSFRFFLNSPADEMQPPEED